MTAALFASIAVAGFAVTYAWRLLGVLAVKRIDPESDVLLWVRALATALVAALVVRLVVSPSGPLAETTELARFGALAAGIAVFFRVRRVEHATAAAIVAFFLAQAAGF
jgi:branched-subunit amino acid transport protein